MAYAASPQIQSTYTRRMTAKTRPKTPEHVTDGLDESSLAPWWNTERYINSNTNNTPFRKQKYEPLKWANADLLLDEDGADFLVDDPYATPISRPQSVRKTASIRRRKSSLKSAQMRSSLSHTSPSQRPLTLADLTPRSRRISSSRVNRTPRRSSASNARALQLSANGPGFGPDIPSQALQPIQEATTQQEATPLLDPSLPTTPQRDPKSPLPPPTSRKSRHSATFNLDINVQKTDLQPLLEKPVPLLTPTTPVINTYPQSDEKSARKRRKGGRNSTVPSNTANPTNLQDEDDDDEELHRSIPGAFDFSVEHQVQPLPNTIFTFTEPPLPVPAIKSHPASRRPSTVIQKDITAGGNVKEGIDVPKSTTAPVLTGLAGKLAEYGDRLMGLINPNEVALAQAPLKKSANRTPNLRLSELSPRKRKTTVPMKLERKLHMLSKVPRAIAMPSAPVSKRRNEPVEGKVVTTSQLSTKPQALSSPKETFASRPLQPPMTRSTVTKVKAEKAVIQTEGKSANEDRVEVIPEPLALLPPFEPLVAAVPELFGEPPLEAPRSTAILHPQRGAEILDCGFTQKNQAIAADSPDLQVLRALDKELPAERPEVPHHNIIHREESALDASSARTEAITDRASLEPARLEMKVGKKMGDDPKRLPKPILKKRPLEEGTLHKSVAHERAIKRQKVHRSSSMVDRPSMGNPSGPDTHERGRDTRMCHGKTEMAPKKPKSRSRAAVREEGVPVAPLRFTALPENSLMNNHSQSPPRGLESLQENNVARRMGDGGGEMHTRDQVQEDVFGSIIENSVHEISGEFVLPAERSRREEAYPRTDNVPSPATGNKYPYILESFDPGEHLIRSETGRILRPSRIQNSSEQHRLQPTLRTAPRGHEGTIPYHVADVTRPMDQLLPERLFGYKDRENEPCRLTIPVSPKFMRSQREREREKAQKEKERLEELERQLNAQRKERIRKTRERRMPPIAAALLAKLAGAKEGAGIHRPQESARPPTSQFTFVSDLRPILGRDGAISAERTLKEQFESRRNLWEQRALEASQESSSGKLHSFTLRTGPDSRSQHDHADSYASFRHLDQEYSRREKGRHPLQTLREPPSHAASRLAQRERRKERAEQPAQAASRHVQPSSRRR